MHDREGVAKRKRMDRLNEGGLQKAKNSAHRHLKGYDRGAKGSAQKDWR